jgi:hypothetical protein
MTTRLLVPPTMNELFESPVYRKFIQRNVSLPDNVRHGFPWMIMVRRTPEYHGSTWGRKLVPTYKEAYFMMRDYLKDSTVEDVSIISRRVLFGPPMGFEWPSRKFPWCGRCRRPTQFQYMLKHPALNGASVLTYDNPFRCVYCGMRESAMPRYRPVRKS